jgi:hypothetical protein
MTPTKVADDSGLGCRSNIAAPRCEVQVEVGDPRAYRVISMHLLGSGPPSTLRANGRA